MFRGGTKTGCRRVKRVLSEYADQRLGEEERLAVRRHLDTCEACSRELASLRMTVRLLHEVPVVPVPRSFAVRRQEVERVIEPAPQRLRWLRPATAVAVFTLVMVLAVDFLQLVPGQLASERGGLATPSTQAMLSPAKASVSVPAGYSQSLVPGVAVTADGSFYVYDESQVPSNVRVKPSGEIRVLTPEGAISTGISVSGAVIDSERARSGGYLPPAATAKAAETPGASPSSSPTPLVELISGLLAGNQSGNESAGNRSGESALPEGSQEGTSAGWPARQIEIAIGVVALGLMSTAVYTTWHGRGRSGAK